MITKVTKENKALYKALFEKVNEEFNWTSDAEAITSLDWYFAQLEEIANKNPIYRVLPLDEPTFDIDANTRQIAIPEEFRKNGISVQGDQISEIIFFTIDRYVDTMDLYRDDINIVIQWETAPLTTGKTTKSEKGLSLAYLKDVSLFKTEGKMLFGWALNDTITQNAGLVKFSVRFYKLNADKEIDFSLSTLTAQATINPGLNYTWEAGAFTDKVYDDYQLIQNRIKDSVQPGDAGVAGDPEFLEGFHLDTAFELTVQEKNEKGEIVETTYKAIDLKKEVEGDNTVLQRDFIVQASGEGSISYRWSRKDLNDNTEVDLEISDAVGIEYIPTKDTKYSGEKLYYT